MEKVLLIDGSGLLFQSFYGMPKKITNPKGQYIEAVICFIAILLKSIKIINPTRLLIVFDGENNLERKDIDPEYKANRPSFSDIDDKDNPFPQLELIKEVLTHLNIKFIETENEEADDYIASFVNNYKTEAEIFISSSDKDFYQLINDNVNVFTYRGKVSKIWDYQSIIEKFSFEAKHFSTYKALIGDPSDNIKGIKGIGNKTATKLILNFGSIENIIRDAKTKEDKISLLIKTNEAKLLKNYSIINLKNKFNKTLKIDELTFNNIEYSAIEILKQVKLL